MVGHGEEHGAPSLLHFSLVGGLTLLLVVAGVALAILLIGRREVPTTAPATRSPFVLAGRNDLYGDRFNEAVFMRPGQGLVRGLVAADERVVDGGWNATADALAGASQVTRRAQNGYVRSYALTMVAGAAMVAVVLILGRLA